MKDLEKRISRLESREPRYRDVKYMTDDELAYIITGGKKKAHEISEEELESYLSENHG